MTEKAPPNYAAFDRPLDCEFTHEEERAAIDAACAPAIAQRDELLAEVERLTADADHGIAAQSLRANEAEQLARELLAALEELVDKNLANRGTEHVFVRCYTYEGLPRHYRDAEALIRHATEQLGEPT